MLGARLDYVAVAVPIGLHFFLFIRQLSAKLRILSPRCNVAAITFFLAAVSIFILWPLVTSTLRCQLAQAHRHAKRYQLAFTDLQNCQRNKVA